VVVTQTEDARMTMSSLPRWYSGHAVASFLRDWPLADVNRWRLLPTRANAQLAFGSYTWDEDTGLFTPHSVDVLTLAQPRSKRSPPSSLPTPSGTSACPITSSLRWQTSRSFDDAWRSRLAHRMPADHGGDRGRFLGEPRRMSRASAAYL
jgi:hypothetical protein